MRRSASIARLMELKDVTEEEAQVIKEIWTNQPTRSRARRLIDEAIRTHGVEFLGISKRSGKDVYYCNAGDTYATTIIFHGDTLSVGCWGDWCDPVDRVRQPNDIY